MFAEGKNPVKEILNSDVTIEKYEDNYIQLSREDQISKTYEFDEGEIVNYPDMEYRMYSYNLYSMPGTCEDATPYMFPFDKHLTTNDHGTYGLQYQASNGQTWYSSLYYNHFAFIPSLINSFAVACMFFPSRAFIRSASLSLWSTMLILLQLAFQYSFM